MGLTCGKQKIDPDSMSIRYTQRTWLIAVIVVYSHLYTRDFR